LQLLENSVVTGAVLVALILALQPVSAAFNPVVTLVERVLGALTTAQGQPIAQVKTTNAGECTALPARGPGVWLSPLGVRRLCSGLPLQTGHGRPVGSLRG
jgi:hypothetical protein